MRETARETAMITLEDATGRALGSSCIRGKFVTSAIPFAKYDPARSQRMWLQKVYHWLPDAPCVLDLCDPDFMTPQGFRAIEHAKEITVCTHGLADMVERATSRKAMVLPDFVAPSLLQCSDPPPRLSQAIWFGNPLNWPALDEVIGSAVERFRDHKVIVISSSVYTPPADVDESRVDSRLWTGWGDLIDTLRRGWFIDAPQLPQFKWKSDNRRHIAACLGALEGTSEADAQRANASRIDLWSLFLDQFEGRYP